ncbi:MAG: bifunctional proline dehydrogenase/L-glutamate gamma-semialdehyde dehydrogenase, partial [Candidatus Omnitrophica bacterium]|nr:bifunctional proline dehydrogenase/L-glutamate gamma-semialdehyde dehydrogenase [Candidatus Omnitrophota bacterium]
GASCSLDILGEQVLSEEEADRYAAQCRTLLQQSLKAYAGKLQTNLSVKPSALTARFDPISPSQSVERAAKRLLPLCHIAQEYSALITLDAEQALLRDLTLQLAQRLLLHPDYDSRHASLGIVIQAYLRDAQATVENLLQWLASHERSLHVRLVKGAYWDHEVAYARQCHWPVPVHEGKALTDAAFERLTERLLGAGPFVTTAVASHNVRSIAHAMAVAEALKLPKEQVEFQLLYGMADTLLAAIVSMGYPVRVYTPIGELVPGMAYLVRRILENTANESFLRQDFLGKGTVDEWIKKPSVAQEPSPAASIQTEQWGEPLLNPADETQRRRFAKAISTALSSTSRRHPLLLGDGEVQTAQAVPVSNPAHLDQTLGEICLATAAEAQRAVELATQAQKTWSNTAVAERVRCLRQAAHILRSQRQELTALEVLEVGKTWREADVDVVEAIEYLEYYSQQMLDLAQGKPVLELPGERNFYRYTSRGVSVVISPWNFPAAILTGMACAALVSGSAVILKPAGRSMLTALRVTRILREAGIPPSVVQCLPGQGQTIGEMLVRDPRTHVVLFTGSKAVGLSILEACRSIASGQRFIKQVVAEMGGKNAIFVDADADLDSAILGILRSAFSYGGQKCSAASRLILHEAIYDRLLRRLIGATDRLVVGDPADASTDMGPLIEQSAKQRLVEAREYARKIAKVVYEYPESRLPGDGHFFGPCIVTDVAPYDKLAQEELFGPLLVVFRVRHIKEALALANDTDYALTGGIYTRTFSHMEKALREWDVGNFYINRPITGAMVGRQPFGGHRLSGLGTKAGGPDYLLQLLIPKTICTDTTRYGIPLEGDMQ